MTRRPLLGLSLHADRAFLSHHRRLIEHEAELFEVMPEGLWVAGAEPGSAYDLFRDIQQRSGRPFVAHGTLFSLGAAAPPPRRARWLEALARDQEAFEFLWFSDHLGFADADRVHVALPLPLPPCPASVSVCAGSIGALQGVFPLVAFENNVAYFRLGDPVEEPRLFAEVCARTGAAMVLDLHNAFTTCHNFGLELDDWLSRIELERVVEIHVSGGSDSDSDWLPSGRIVRLDSHDTRVPEPVWDALESVAPRCPALRAVIVEQVAEGLDAAMARDFAADFDRAKSIVHALPETTPCEPAPRPAALEPLAGTDDTSALGSLQHALARACTSADPVAALAAADVDDRARPWLDDIDSDGLRLTSLLVKKLRFERLTRGDPVLAADFERDPAGFVERWTAFARATTPAVFPEDEARAFAAFVD